MSRKNLSIMFSAFIAVVLSGVAPAAFAGRGSSPVQNFPAHEYDLTARCPGSDATCAKPPTQAAEPEPATDDDIDDEDLSSIGFTKAMSDVLVSSFSWPVNPSQ